MSQMAHQSRAYTLTCSLECWWGSVASEVRSSLSESPGSKWALGKYLLVGELGKDSDLQPPPHSWFSSSSDDFTQWKCSFKGLTGKNWPLWSGTVDMKYSRRQQCLYILRLRKTYHRPIFCHFDFCHILKVKNLYFRLSINIFNQIISYRFICVCGQNCSEKLFCQTFIYVSFSKSC